MRHRLQRLDHQGRHLLPDDGEKASAGARDRARESAAVHLSRRLRRRQSAASDRRISRPRSFRPHFLQPGDHVGGRHSPDRGRHGVLHCRRRLCAGDVGRDHHRSQSRHDFSRWTAAGQSRHRRNRHCGRAGRRRRACEEIRRCRLLRRERSPCARAVPPDRRHAQCKKHGRRDTAQAKRAAIRCERA
jgi:hypothetical protein